MASKFGKLHDIVNLSHEIERDIRGVNSDIHNALCAANSLCELQNTTVEINEMALAIIRCLKRATETLSGIAT